MKHYIIAKFDKDFELETHLSDIKAIFDKTLAIQGVKNISLIPGVNRAGSGYKNRYDLMIEMTLEKESLPAYDKCEAHKEWKAKYGPMIETKCIFDCE